MSISSERLQKIAELGNLRLTAAEIQRFTRDFEDIIDFVDQLGKLDVRETPVTNQVTELENVFEGDVVETSVHARTIVQNISHRTEDLITVPGVFEERTG